MIWKLWRAAENHMQWLREHMRNHIGEPSDQPTEKVLSFRRASAGPAKRQDTEAVELVNQAADMVRGVQDGAAQNEARAEDPVKGQVAKRQVAEDCIRSSEGAQSARGAG